MSLFGAEKRLFAFSEDKNNHTTLACAATPFLFAATRFRKWTSSSLKLGNNADVFRPVTFAKWLDCMFLWAQRSMWLRHEARKLLVNCASNTARHPESAQSTCRKSDIKLCVCSVGDFWSTWSHLEQEVGALITSQSQNLSTFSHLHALTSDVKLSIFCLSDVWNRQNLSVWRFVWNISHGVLLQEVQLDEVCPKVSQLDWIQWT